MDFNRLSDGELDALDIDAGVVIDGETGRPEPARTAEPRSVSAGSSAFDYSRLSDDELSRLDADLQRVIDSGGDFSPVSQRGADGGLSHDELLRRAYARQNVDGSQGDAVGDAIMEGVKGAVRAGKAIGGGFVGIGSGAVRLAGTPVRALTGWDGLHRVADSIDSGYEDWGSEALASELPDDDWGRVLGGVGEKIAGTAGSLAALGGGGKLASAAGAALKAAGHAKTAAVAANALPLMFGNDAAVRTYDTAKENGSGTARALGLASVNGAIHYFGFKAFENQSLNKMLGMPQEMTAMMPGWANAAREGGAKTFTELASGVRNGMYKYILAERAKGALKAGGIMGLQNFLSSVPTQWAEGQDVDWGRAVSEGVSGVEEGALMESLMGGAAMLKTPKEARRFIADTYFRNGYDLPNGRHVPGLLHSEEGRSFVMKQNPDMQRRILDIVDHGGKVTKGELNAACLPPDMTEAELREFAKDWKHDLEVEGWRKGEDEFLGDGEELTGSEDVRGQNAATTATVEEDRIAEEAMNADTPRNEPAPLIETAEPTAEQPVAPEQAQAQDPTEPPVAERSNRLRRNLKPNFRHQGENQQQPKQEVTNETGNVPVEAQPEPAVRDAGRGGREQAPQAAEGLVEDEAPRGEVPAAGEVETSGKSASNADSTAGNEPQAEDINRNSAQTQVPVSKSDMGGQKLTGGAKEEATPAFKRGDSVMLKGASDGQRVTFLKPNADGTADVQVRTPGANRYAPEKVETRTVPMGDVSSTGMKETLTLAERRRLADGVRSQAEPPAAEPPKNAPASAPRAGGTTTPPQSAEPVQGGESAAGGVTGGAAEEPKPTQGNKLRRGKAKKGQEPKQQVVEPPKPETPKSDTSALPEAPSTKDNKLKPATGAKRGHNANASADSEATPATPEATTTPATPVAEQVKPASQFRDENGNMKKTLRGAVERIASAIGNRTGKGAITPEEADAIVNGIAESPEVKHNRSARFFTPLVTDAEWQNSLGVDAESAKNLRDAVVRASDASQRKKKQRKLNNAVKKSEAGDKDAPTAYGLVRIASDALDKAKIKGDKAAEARAQKALEEAQAKFFAEYVQVPDADKEEWVKKQEEKFEEWSWKHDDVAKNESTTADAPIPGKDGSSTTLAEQLPAKNVSSDDDRGGFKLVPWEDGELVRKGRVKVEMRLRSPTTGKMLSKTVEMTRTELTAKLGKNRAADLLGGHEILASVGAPESLASRGARFAADADYQRWLKSRKANDAEPLRQRYEMEQAKALGDAFKNAVGGVDVEYVGDRDYDPAIDGGGDRGRDVRHSRVTDNAELERLNGGETVKVYRAMQMIDGKLYPPMAAKVDGKLVEPTEIGTWYRADERPDLIKDGKFKLDKANGAAIEARYNPYFHTSRSPLNDQFSSANKRPNLVTVEVEIPKSELTSGYRAEGAKDAVGEMDWHSGPVSSKLPRDKARKVILSRWAKVVRVVPDAEVADVVARTLNGERLSVPENTVTPSLRRELEQRGVRISNKGEPVRYLRDRDTGTVLGIFDRDTGKLKLFRGASWKTLNHELDGHATMRLAEQEAERGNRALLDKINESIDSAPQWLKDEVRSRYPDADEATLRDEIWAALRERPSEAMQKYVKTLQGRKWYNRAWDAIKTAWRGILSRMGFNRADLSGIDKMTPDEFNEFLDKAMIGGKTLGKIETASRQSSVRMARGPVTPGPDVRIMDDEVKWLDRQGERFVDSTHNLRKVQNEVGYRDRSDPKSVGVEEVIDPKTGFVDWRKSSDIHKAIVKSNGFVQKNEHILQVRRDKATREMAKMKGLSEDAKRELVDDYLTALHAEERNRTIADRRGDTYNDDYAEGAGRSAKWARDFIANDPNVQKYKAELDRIADIVHEAVVEDLRLRHENGLLSDDEYNFYSKKWKHYVPLRTDVTEGSPEGGAFNTSTATFNRSEYRTAKGRGADNIASSPFAFAFVQAHDGIGKSAKNIIGNVTANFIDMTEAKGLNSTKVEVVAKDGSKSTKTEYRIAEVVPADVVKRGGTKFAATFADGTTAEIGSDMRLASHQDNLVLFKRPEPVIGKDGKPTGETAARLYVAKFTEGKNGRGLAVAKAITGKNMVEVPFWVQPFSKATHFLSRMNTSASPSFLTSNIFNDRNEAWRAMSARFGVLDGAKMAAKVWKYRYADGKDLKNWLENGELRPGSDVADFINGGAAIKGGNIAQGFSGETSSLKDNLARQERKARSWWERFKRIGRFENVREIASSVGDVVQSANELEELGTRYGVYHAVLDELVAKGVPREVAKAEAVTFCRGATTDFNVRGTLAPVIGSFYMFYNANVQGTRRNIQSLTDKRGVQTFATLAGVASAMTVLRYWLGNDEEREKGGERNAKNALEYQKQSAMGIPIPSGRELSILKMRGVDALIPYAATKFTEAALYDDVSAMEALADSLKAAGGEALGVLGGNGVGNKSQISQTLAPSLADPFVQWATGTDWQGERRVKQLMDKTVPQSYNARHGTSDVFKWIAETVNDISGGNQYRKGIVDMAPEDVQLIVETLAGGLGRDVTGAINTFSNVKEVAKGGSSERLFGRMPVVKSLVREYPDSTSRYFDALDEYNADKAEFKKTTELGRRAELKKAHPYLTAKKGRVDSLIEQVQELTHRERGEVKVGQKWVPMKTELPEARKEAFRKRRLRLQAEVLRILGK